MSIRTESLFHFTKSFDVLCKILEAGYFWPRYSLEDLGWVNSPADTFSLAFPMVCFCDIPITRLNDHTKYYGSYGLALSQEWGTQRGLNPLIYINPESPLRSQLAAACNALASTPTSAPTPKEKETLEEQATRDAIHLMAYTKPLIGSTTHGGGTSTEIKIFYEESEWRFVPRDVFTADGFALDETEFRTPKVLEAANERTKSFPLTFSVRDIKYLFVRNVSEIPLLFNFVHARLGKYPADDLKVLTSRILSLEDMEADL